MAVINMAGINMAELPKNRQILPATILPVI